MEPQPTANHSPHQLRPATWRPQWHQLDQGVAVGQTDRFWFHPQQSPGEALRFFNSLPNSEASSEVRQACIVAIEHPELGPLTRIDTRGLDYVFYGVEGTEWIVNAEETPGLIYDDKPVGDWAIQVQLRDVSAPLSELV
jgi:hypothetical protein